MPTLTKEQTIAAMQILAEKLSDLAQTFSDDVLLEVCAFSDGYAHISLATFEDAHCKARLIRRVKRDPKDSWEVNLEDESPEDCKTFAH